MVSGGICSWTQTHFNHLLNITQTKSIFDCCILTWWRWVWKIKWKIVIWWACKITDDCASLLLVFYLLLHSESEFSGLIQQSFLMCASWFLILVYVIFHSLNNKEQILSGRLQLYVACVLAYYFLPYYHHFYCTIKIDHKW